MEIKVEQKLFPDLYVADTQVYDNSIRIISGLRFMPIEREAIPELINALNKLK